MRSGSGYFRISHVVLYLEQSDSSRPVVCFGFPLAWVRGPWESESWRQVGQVQSAEPVLLSFYSVGEFILRLRALCSSLHIFFPSFAKFWRRRSNTGDQKPAALRISATSWTELRGKAGHSSHAHSLWKTNKTTPTGRLMHIHLQPNNQKGSLNLVKYVFSTNFRW